MFTTLSMAQTANSDFAQPKFVTCQAAQDSGIYLTNDGWLIEGSETTWINPNFKNVLPHIIDLQKTFKQMDIDFVPVIIPFRPMVHPESPGETNPGMKNYDYQSARQVYHDMINHLNEGGVISPDLLFYMQDKDVSHHQFFYGDHHITPEGASSIASGIYEQLKYNKVFNSIATYPGTIKSGGFIVHQDPSRTKVLKEKCGTQPNEFIHTVDFSPSKQQDLLSDTVEPKIVYVGTSMGRKDFGLLDNLKYRLGKDILDFHMEGGGAYAPLMNYLSSDYKKSLPKIIIWEWSLEEIVYNREGAPKFSDYNTFNIIKGEVYGCSKPIYITSKTNDVIKPILPKSVVLRVTSDTPMTKVTIAMTGSKTVNYSMDIPDRVDNKLASFYYASLEEQPRSVSISALGGHNVALSICPLR